jgi:hypothetical protein
MSEYPPENPTEAAPEEAGGPVERMDPPSQDRVDQEAAEAQARTAEIRHNLANRRRSAPDRKPSVAHGLGGMAGKTFMWDEVLKDAWAGGNIFDDIKAAFKMKGGGHGKKGHDSHGKDHGHDKGHGKKDHGGGAAHH